MNNNSDEDEFSKLSIKSKSVISCQTMTWIIPQSRLNQQCPFLEKEYPYYTTEFSFVHFINQDLELKWKLILERDDSWVVVNLQNTNDKSVFDKKELRNAELRWSVKLRKSQAEEIYLKSNSIEDEIITIDLQSLLLNKSKGIAICDLACFDRYVVKGMYIMVVSIEIEYFQNKKKKLSILQHARRFSASISDLSSIYSKVTKARRSISSGLGFSTPSRSWIGKTVPNLRRNSYNKESKHEPLPSYQHCSIPLSPPAPAPVSSLNKEVLSPQGTCPPAFFNYRQSGFVQLSDDVEYINVTPGYKEVCSRKDASIRRTMSGRMPSNIETLTKADDTLDSRVSSNVDFDSITQVSRSDNTYTSIPDNVFHTPDPHKSYVDNTIKYSLRKDASQSICSVNSGLTQRCNSTPNPIFRKGQFEHSDYSPIPVCHQRSSAGLKGVEPKSDVWKDATNYAYQRPKTTDKRKPNFIERQLSSVKDYASINHVGLPENQTRVNDHCFDKGQLKESLMSGYIPEWDVLLKERRQFIELASELKLNKLMLKCEEAYLMVIDSANCLETMIIFDKYGSGSIAKRNVIIFIHDNFQRVSSSFQWTEFLRNHPKLVKMIKSPSYANTLII